MDKTADKQVPDPRQKEEKPKHNKRWRLVAKHLYRASREQWCRIRFSGCKILGKLPSLNLTVHIYKWGKAHNSDTETVGSRLDETKIGSLPYTFYLNKFQMDKSFKHKNIKTEKYWKKTHDSIFYNLKSKKNT